MRCFLLLLLLAPVPARADGQAPTPPITSALRQALEEDDPDAVYERYRVTMKGKEVRIGESVLPRRESPAQALLLGLLTLNSEVRSYLESSDVAAEMLPGATRMAVHRILAWSVGFCTLMGMAGLLPALPLLALGVVAGIGLALLYPPLGVVVGGVLVWAGLTAGLTGLAFLFIGFPIAIIHVVLNQGILSDEEAAAAAFNKDLRMRINKLAARRAPAPAPAPLPPPAPEPAPVLPPSDGPHVSVTDTSGCMDAQALQREITALSGDAASGVHVEVSVGASGEVRTLTVSVDGQTAKPVEIGRDECGDAPRVVARIVARVL